ncbi:MAG: universal stress protein [Novosphingobium sp.]|nr:universal stress protein [Novosphingobium sp.]
MTDASHAGTILVSTDLSARSDRAVNRAFALADQTGRRAIVCHVVSPGAAYAHNTDKALKLVRAALPDPDAAVEILLPTGAAPQTLARVANELQPAMVVAGVARFNSIGDYFLGTAVDHLIRHAQVPVLVVKQRAHRAYGRILVTTDFSEASLKALLKAHELFPDSTIDLMHAYHVAFDGWRASEYIHDSTRAEESSEMEEFLAAAALPDSLRSRLTTHLEYGDIGTAMMAAVERLDPDLVVMGTHGHGGFIRATVGSVASSVLEWIDRDMLLVRD